jgi:Dehydrogenases with different specificities (related to short-chain alcohol dehydrogenases)
MNKICVITGGGSGMGRATARIMAVQGYYVVLVGRTAAKLEDTVRELTAAGGNAESVSCDITDKLGTEALARYAAGLGEVKVVIHAAGLSPHMGSAEEIMKGNAVGTININNAFFGVMAPGGCIIDTSSMSAYLTPEFLMPKKAYPLCRTDVDKFFKKMMSRVRLLPKKFRTGAAYGISKHFVIWLAKTDAARFGEKGVRVLSVTPGNFETPMGTLEKDEALTYIRYNAIKRTGRPEEIAQLFAFLADERLGYLTGTDILCDGGCIASGVNPLFRR